MVSQMRRAAVFVCSNLAERSERYTSKDQSYFCGLAYIILMKLLNQILMARELYWLKDEEEVSQDLKNFSKNQLITKINTKGCLNK